MSREKWTAFLQGKDVGTMVSPLVDHWCLAEPYAWPFDEPEPFPPGHEHHDFGAQMAMAGWCGYDPLFLVQPPFVYTHNLKRQVATHIRGGREITETRIETPFGDLFSSVEHDLATGSMHQARSFIETEADYPKFMWTLEQEYRLDREQSIERGQKLLSAGRDKGMTGTWWGPPGVSGIAFNDVFYHIEDYPDLFNQALELNYAVNFQKLDVLKAMGFDYLFYLVAGTELISPALFEQYVRPYARQVFDRWHSLGGFILWHTCGHAREFMSRGYYSQLMPDIFETLSEPPVGDLPSLAWGRERLDRRIISKGNIDLGIIRNGSEEAIRAQVRRVLQETRGYRHIVGASDNILQDTPLANMRTLVDEVRNSKVENGENQDR